MQSFAALNAAFEGRPSDRLLPSHQPVQNGTRYLEEDCATGFFSSRPNTTQIINFFGLSFTSLVFVLVGFVAIGVFTCGRKKMSTSSTIPTRV
jgi:hypothetical protein